MTGACDSPHKTITSAIGKTRPFAADGDVLRARPTVVEELVRLIAGQRDWLVKAARFPSFISRGSRVPLAANVGIAPPVVRPGSASAPARGRHRASRSRRR